MLHYIADVLGFSPLVGRGESTLNKALDTYMSFVILEYKLVLYLYYCIYTHSNISMYYRTLSVI